MIRLGLCSGAYITRDIHGVIAAALAARLEAVEWAADLHVAADDVDAAGETMIATLMAGLTTASYATLYRAGAGDESLARFDTLLRIASTLQSPIMRIYAGAEPKSAAEADKVDSLVPELKRLGDRAAKKGITLCLSMGRGTRLDRYDRAIGLVEAVGHDFVRLAWEDLPGAKPEEATAALEGLGRLAGLAIARCTGRGGGARPLAEEMPVWRARLGAFKTAEADPKMASFVFLGAARAEGQSGDESLAADADALRALVADIQGSKPKPGSA